MNLQMVSFRIFSNSNVIAEKIASCWYDQAQRAARDKRMFSVVLSGGTTASLVYRHLAKYKPMSPVIWKWVHIFWADERCVPPEHKESNYLNIQRTFLSDIQIPMKNIHRIRGENEPFSECLRYEKEITDHLLHKSGDHKLFDWVLLGVGADGHTASIFPGQEFLLGTQDLCVVVTHPVTGKKRITLTPYALNLSDRVTYNVIGLDKAVKVSDLISEKSRSNRFPTGYVEGEWFLDYDAASRLKFS
jgi:6-phosphogluconolactonase